MTTDEPMTQGKHEVALSFAGEDRAFVQPVADALAKTGLSVIFDEFAAESLSGKDLYERLARVYGTDARLTVLFASEHYAATVWPSRECRIAQARALRAQRESVLPVRLDDTLIPGLQPTPADSLAVRYMAPETLAGIICRHVQRSAPRSGADDGEGVRDIQSVKRHLWPVLERLEVRREGARPLGLTSNITAIDDLTDGFGGRTFIPFCGSLPEARDFALHCAFMAAAHRKPVAVLAAYERHGRIGEQLLVWLAGRRFRGASARELTAVDDSAIAWAARFAGGLPLYFVDQTRPLHHVHRALENLKKEKGIEFVLIDDLAAFARRVNPHDDPQAERRFVQGLRGIADELCLTVFTIIERPGLLWLIPGYAADALDRTSRLRALGREFADFAFDIFSGLSMTSVMVEIVDNTHEVLDIIRAPRLPFGRFGDGDYWDVLRVLEQEKPDWA